MTASELRVNIVAVKFVSSDLPLSLICLDHLYPLPAKAKNLPKNYNAAKHYESYAIMRITGLAVSKMPHMRRQSHAMKNVLYHGARPKDLSGVIKKS